MSRVHWPLALRVADRFTGDYPLAGTYHETRLAGEMPELVARAGELVSTETGLVGGGSPAVSVVSRFAWVEANVAAFGALLAPAEERLAHSRGLGGYVAGRLVAAELGAILGMLSRRVLGQYELVIPTGDSDAGDTVFFVGANVLHIERLHEFRPRDFRFWVALHECTHRLQFTGVPWLRGYFLDLVGELVATSIPEPGRVGRVARELRDAAEAGEPLLGEAGLLGLFATPAQRTTLDRVQALMSLLEGHGHVVMDRIGAREIPGLARMSRVLKQRRRDPRTAGLLKLVGMEMKFRQYELGEKFIAGVERHAGWEALDRAWSDPENLPTLEEIENPVLWLDRVG